MEQRHPWVGTHPSDGVVAAVRELQPVVDVEPPRHGEDPADCRSCASAAEPPDELEVYRDDLWRVRLLGDTAFPGACMLSPLRHADGVHGLDDRELASYGPVVARVTRALEGLTGFRGARTARVHGHLWNDGGAHLHQWFFPRPYGYPDLLGSTLVEWEEVLPRASAEEVRAAAAELRRRLQG